VTCPGAEVETRGVKEDVWNGTLSQNQIKNVTAFRQLENGGLGFVRKKMWPSYGTRTITHAFALWQVAFVVLGPSGHEQIIHIQMDPTTS